MSTLHMPFKQKIIGRLIVRPLSTFPEKNSFDKLLDNEHTFRFDSVQFPEAETSYGPESLEQGLSSLHLNAESSVEVISSILQKCKKEKNLCLAMHILVHVHSFGLEDHEQVGNHVVPMLVECGGILCAFSIFHKLSYQNEYSWTSLIQGYINLGELQTALELFQKMQCSAIVPSMFTLQSLVKVCARLECIETGRQMHIIVVVEDYEKDLIVANTLVDFYAKCGFFEEAWSVLMELPVRNVISWNSLIAGHVQHGFMEEALDCFVKMKCDGVVPDNISFICGLRGASYVGIHKVQELHTEIIRQGFERYFYIGNSLIDVYGKGGLLAEALEIFDELIAPDVVSWNALITSYAEHGFYEKALICLDQMRIVGVYPDDLTYICSLKACHNPAMTGQGRQLHSQIIKEGYDSSFCIGNALVNMYSRNSLFADAWKIFHKLSIKNIDSWTSLIAGCAESGLSEKGLTCWENMCAEGVSPTAFTIVCSLKNCSALCALEKGLEIHLMAVEEGFERNLFISNALVDMYSKCGLIVEAEEVFKEMPVKDIVGWTTLITGCAECGCGEDALRYFDEMLLEHISPNFVTFLSISKVCSNLQHVDRGQQLHIMITKVGFENEDALKNSLIDMYFKCGLVEEAQLLFKKRPDSNTTSWNLVISGYADHGLGDDAITFFEEMKEKKVSPDDITLVCALKSCSSKLSVNKVHELYLDIAKFGYDKDYFVSSSLIHVYAKHGMLCEAYKLFADGSARDIASWNAFFIGIGYAEYALEELLKLCDLLGRHFIAPDAVTLSCILKACANLVAKVEGQEIHSETVKRGFDLYPHINCSLVDFYSKCGLVIEAKNIFDRISERNVGVWTSLMAGYAEHGSNIESLKCLSQMKLEGVSPTAVTFLCILKGYLSKDDIEKGREIHSEIVKYGNEKDPSIVSTLVHMYGKCGRVLDGQSVFDGLPLRVTITWTSLISAYVECGCNEIALNWFEKIYEDSLVSDAITYLWGLKACSSLILMEKGQMIHAEVVQMGLDRDVFLCGALVDFYAKCGLLMEAQILFNSHIGEDSLCWTALIAGFSSQGESETVFALLESMECLDMVLTDVALLSILVVCSHAGLVDIGLSYMKLFIMYYHASMTIEHYNCFLDLLGRAGQVDAATISAESLSFQPDFVTWRIILGACVKHDRLEFGGRALKYASLLS